MKAMTKITMVTASILTMGALSACQSTPAPQKDDHRGHMMGQKIVYSPRVILSNI